MASVHLGTMHTPKPIDAGHILDSIGKGISIGVTMGKLGSDAEYAKGVEAANAGAEERLADVNAREAALGRLASTDAASIDTARMNIPQGENGAIEQLAPGAGQSMTTRGAAIPGLDGQGAIPGLGSGEQPEIPQMQSPAGEAIPRREMQSMTQDTQRLPQPDYSAERRALDIERRNIIYERNSAILKAGIKHASELGDVETVERLRREQGIADFTKMHMDLWENESECNKILAEWASKDLPDGQRYVVADDGSVSLVDARGQVLQSGIRVSPQQRADLFQDMYQTRKFFQFGDDRAYNEYMNSKRNFEFNKQKHADEMNSKAEDRRNAVDVAKIGANAKMFAAKQSRLAYENAAKTRADAAVATAQEATTRATTVQGQKNEGALAKVAAKGEQDRRTAVQQGKIKKELEANKQEFAAFQNQADRDLKKAIHEETVKAGIEKFASTNESRERIAEIKAAADRYAADLKLNGVILSNGTRENIAKAAQDVKLYGIDVTAASRKYGVDVNYVLGVLRNDTKLSGYAMRLQGVLDRDATTRRVAEAQNIQRTFEAYMRHGDENGAYDLAKQYGVQVTTVTGGPHKGQVVYVGPNGKPYATVGEAIRKGASGGATKRTNRSAAINFGK